MEKPGKKLKKLLIITGTTGAVMHILHHCGSDRVAVDIAQYPQEVAFGCDRLGFVTALEERACPLVAAVVVGNVPYPDGLHHVLQGIVTILREQMQMVAHQAVCHDDKIFICAKIENM